MASSSGAAPNGVAAGSAAHLQNRVDDARSANNPRASVYSRRSADGIELDAIASSANRSSSIVQDSQHAPVRTSSTHGASDPAGSVLSETRKSTTDAPDAPVKPAEPENEWHWMFDVDFGVFSV